MAAKKPTRKRKHRTPPPKNKGHPRTLLLPINNETLDTLKKVLRDIYFRLISCHDTLVVVGQVLTESLLEHNAETGRVLLRGATNPLSKQFDELRFVIKQLGGHDLFVGDQDNKDDAERTKFGELE